MENVFIDKIMIYGSNGRLLDVVRIAEFSNMNLMEELKIALPGLTISPIFAPGLKILKNVQLV